MNKEMYFELDNSSKTLILKLYDTMIALGLDNISSNLYVGVFINITVYKGYTSIEVLTDENKKDYYRIIDGLVYYTCSDSSEQSLVFYY